jgi:hypothetical protein
MVLTPMLFAPIKSNSQQYKLKQVTTTDYARIENTIYVKGMRQRIETGAGLGMNGNLATILQCDLKRTVTLDSVKKLYFIEPFNNGRIETTVNPAKEPTAVKEDKYVKKGGTITVWYNLRDTGERKKMFGFTARHIWSDQKTKPSPDACSMKDSMMMYTDGWYIDLPEFNCPMTHEGFAGGYNPQDGCEDKMIVHESGKAKMGFPLIQTTTMIIGDHKMVTKIETLELSTSRLDSSLFTIPRGYRESKNKEELIAGINMGEMMENAIKNEDQAHPAKAAKETKMPGVIRIGVYAPTGNNDIQTSEVQGHIISYIAAGDVEAIAVSNEEDARRYKCDYTLTITYSNIKSATKAANVLRAIRKTDPNALSTYAVQGNLLLTSLKDGTVKNQQPMDGKYDGKINEAAGKAVGEHWNAMRKLLQK